MNNPVVADRPLKPLGYQLVEATTTAAGLPSIPKTAAYASVQAQGGLVRWRDDGTAPTGASGHQLANLTTHFYVGDLSKFFFIKDTTESGTVKLSVSYYEVA